MKKSMTFERFETKYILTLSQYRALNAILNQYFEYDLYPYSHIISVYYDTDTFLLIRQSLEATTFKEKLRMRTYVNPLGNVQSYIEIKRKCDGVIYKRRKKIEDGIPSSEFSQVENEIEYLNQVYKSLKPRVLIGYDRKSYKALNEPDFRLTLDSNIKYRNHSIESLSDYTGDPILDSSLCLMEVKTRCGYPRWFLDYLSQNNVRKQSFSKYGIAYQKIVQGGLVYVR